MRGLTRLRTLTIAALLMLAVACGSEGETASPATVPVPRQTATATPPPRSPSTPLSALSAAEWELRGLSTVRAFPPELEEESNRLPANEVEALWSKFLGGSRWVDNSSGQEIFNLCSGKSGVHLDWWDGSEYHLMPFVWTIQKDPGGRWNTVRIVVVMDDLIRPLPGAPQFNVVIGREDGVFVAAFDVKSSEGGDMLFFDSPDCD